MSSNNDKLLGAIIFLVVALPALLKEISLSQNLMNNPNMDAHNQLIDIIINNTRPWFWDMLANYGILGVLLLMVVSYFHKKNK